jgi:hypothetical protein
MAEGLKSHSGTFLRSPANGDFCDKNGVAKHEAKKKIHNEECRSSTLPNFERKFPDIPQSNCTSRCCGDKSESIGKFASCCCHSYLLSRLKRIKWLQKKHNIATFANIFDESLSRIIFYRMQCFAISFGRMSV